MPFFRLKKWWQDERAAIAIEAGMILPLMAASLIGTVDVGIGIVVNHKVTTATQLVGDLLGRMEQVAIADIDNVVAAGTQALDPYDTTELGFDIVGIQFAGGPNAPTIRWRDTINMAPNPDVLTGASGLGNDEEGVISVTVEYLYEPYFTSVIAGVIEMQEVAYIRGRQGVYIPRV